MALLLGTGIRRSTFTVQGEKVVFLLYIISPANNCCDYVRLLMVTNLLQCWHYMWAALEWFYYQIWLLGCQEVLSYNPLWSYGLGVSV